MTFKPDYLCDNPICADVLNEQLEARKADHARGLELAKALTVCIEAIAPADRGGISMHEWNQRLKAAQKQACAALSDSGHSIHRQEKTNDDG